MEKSSVSQKRTRWCAAAICVTLLSGCGDESVETSEVSKAEPQLTTSTVPTTSTEPTERSVKDTTAEAKSAVLEAASSVQSAAGALTQQVKSKVVGTSESVTEVTAGLVKQAADRVTEVAEAVEASVVPVDGEGIYKGLCFSCHDFGVAGAPKVGATADWTARVAQGQQALYLSAINGKGAMPPKGGGMTLSDAEVKAAVDYMVSRSQ